MLHVALILCWMNSLETASTFNPLWESSIILCYVCFHSQARRSTTGSGDKKSVSKWSIMCISNCSLPFSKCSINLESLAVHCFFNCSFYFIDKYFCVVVKKHDSHFRPVGAIQCHIVPTVSHSYTKRHYMHIGGGLDISLRGNFCQSSFLG